MLCQCFILAGVLWPSKGAHVMEQVEKLSVYSPKKDCFGWDGASWIYLLWIVLSKTKSGWFFFFVCGVGVFFLFMGLLFLFVGFFLFVFCFLVFFFLKIRQKTHQGERCFFSEIKTEFPSGNGLEVQSEQVFRIQAVENLNDFVYKC